MKFSITIPAYKSLFLNEAIRSVISQTYPEWELIIVDDCSPEPLQQIVKPFLTDQRVHFYRNVQNCGIVDVVDNWNICLSYCTGDYIICMGDDDRLLPNCLEEYMKLIKAHPGLNVYHAKAQIIDKEGNVTGHQEDRPEYETCQEMLYRQWKGRCVQFLGDFLLSRKWLNNNGGYVKFPLAYTSDWATANLAAKDKGIANAQVTMFEYRDHQNSISRSQNLKLTVKASCISKQWYQNTFSGILPPFFDKCIIKNKSDLIYLDIKKNPLPEAIYWFCNRKSTGLSFLKMQETIIRAIIASLRRH